MPKSAKSSAKRDNLYFLTGENDFELKRFFRKWEQSALAKYGEFNVSRFDFAANRDVSELVGELAAPPFFGDGKRVFLIENFPPAPGRGETSEKRKQAALALASELAQMPAENVAVLACANPDKRTAAYKQLLPLFTEVRNFEGWDRDQRSGAITALGMRQAAEWAQKEAAQAGLRLDTATTAFLVEFCGTEPWKLYAELSKLQAFATGSGRQVTRADIEKNCLPSEEMANFAFSNAVQTGDFAAIMVVFDQLMGSGEAPQAILARDLIPTLRHLLVVRASLDQGKGAAEARVHPFIFEKLRSSARRLPLTALLAAHEALCRIDIDMKTGRLPATPERLELFRLAAERILIRLFLASTPVRAA